MNYKWIFGNDSFQCAKSLDGLSNVVEVIHWRYEAADGDLTASIGGCTAFTAPSPDSFKPFEELTEETIIGWLEAANYMEAVQAAANNELEQAKVKQNQEYLTPNFLNAN